MRPLFVLLAASLLLVHAPSALAQENETERGLARWVGAENEGAWWVLVPFGALGVAATLLPVVGGVFPGTFGATALKKRQEQLQAKEDRYDVMTANGRKDPDADELWRDIESLRMEVTREKWRVFFTAGFLYAIAGLVSAAFLANDWKEAVLLGAGGPALVGSLMATVETRRKLQEKSEALDAAILALGGKPEAGSLKAVHEKLAQAPDKSRLVDALRVARRL